MTMADETKTEAPIVGVSGVTNVRNGNGHTKEIIVRWIGVALVIVLVGVISIGISALWKPPQDWAIEDHKLTETDICRIAICNISGALCTCDYGGDPTAYLTRPRHSADGGSITCTMPACNKAAPE